MEISVDMAAFKQMALASLLAMIVFAIIAGIVLRLAKLDQRTWLPGQIFPNTGNMACRCVCWPLAMKGCRWA